MAAASNGVSISVSKVFFGGMAWIAAVFQLAQEHDVDLGIYRICHGKNKMWRKYEETGSLENLPKSSFPCYPKPQID
ncbi:hypothetical protein [Collimonas pratensis]|nr:hypothetical protein [Collimonas pratensis]